MNPTTNLKIGKIRNQRKLGSDLATSQLLPTALEAEEEIKIILGSEKYTGLILGTDRTSSDLGLMLEQSTHENNALFLNRTQAWGRSSKQLKSGSVPRAVCPGSELVVDPVMAPCVPVLILQSLGESRAQKTRVLSCLDRSEIAALSLVSELRRSRFEILMLLSSR